VTVAHDLDAALALAVEAARAVGVAEAMVIGGGEIYAQAMGSAARLYITHVHATPAGTAHFPVIAADTWLARSSEDFPGGEKDTASTTFTVYERRIFTG
jgi:dihydrofolate reductase